MTASPWRILAAVTATACTTFAVVAVVAVAAGWLG